MTLLKHLLTMEINQTNPPKPDGIIPTPIPLSMSATLTGAMPALPPPFQTTCLDRENEKILIGSFEITDTMTPGTLLFTWDAESPLNGFWNGVTEVPWTLLKTYYSRSTAFDVQLEFQPKKVTDSAVILQQLNVFDDNAIPDPLAIDEYNRENSEIVLSAAATPVTVDIPLFWLAPVIPTRNFFRPVYGPKTRSYFYIKEMFVPNNLQPPQFTTLVFLSFTRLEKYGHAGLSVGNMITPTTTDNIYFK